MPVHCPKEEPDPLASILSAVHSDTTPYSIPQSPIKAMSGAERRSAELALLQDCLLQIMVLVPGNRVRYSLAVLLVLVAL